MSNTSKHQELQKQHSVADGELKQHNENLAAIERVINLVNNTHFSGSMAGAVQATQQILGAVHQATAQTRDATKKRVDEINKAIDEAAELRPVAAEPKEQINE